MERIALRPVTHNDGAELAAANRRNVRYHAPWCHPFTDEDGFAAWFTRQGKDSDAAFLARREETAELVALFHFSRIALGNFRSAYLGFYGFQETAGRGLVAQALRQVADHAFARIELNRIEANIQPGNQRSITLVGRAGFRKEGFSPKYLKIGGEWRDHERWALLAEHHRRSDSSTAS